MTPEQRPTVLAATVLGFGCGLAASAVLAAWWTAGPNSVSCYYGSYEPFGGDDAISEMLTKMWPTWWLWVGVLVAPTVAGALLGVLAARFGVRVQRLPR
ncbi:hypothetical protein ACFO5K_01615 [Nocardia halotolerans]|uniref:Uncharacterized protein n=1 Tax=Nocardia halotolerans TaxID=1755878 RepID=A0ABV8VDL6_9NOCA